MRSFLTAGMILASALLMCNGEGLIYDIKTSELINDKEVNIQEREVFIEESYVTPEPPVIYMNGPNDKDLELGSEEGDVVGRETYNLTALELAAAFGKEEPHIPEEHMNFQFAFGMDSIGNQQWSQWTCCRSALKIKSRKRTIGTRIELEYSKCWNQYCAAHECKDVPFICPQFIGQFGAKVCNPSNGMSTFMSHHCPQTCRFCSSFPATSRPTAPPTTTRPWWVRPTTTARTRRPFTTPKPVRTTPRPLNRNLVQVTILSHNLNQPFPTYKFDIRNQMSGAWRRIPNGGAELSSIFLYSRPIGNFNIKLSFCSTKDRNTGLQKYQVRKGECARSWTTEFVLYGSKYRSKDAQIYYVGNRGKPHWTSKVSRTYPIRGYPKGIFYFYGPKPTTLPTTQRPTTRPRTTRPFTRPTTRPRTTRPFTRPTQHPFPTTTRPTGTGPQPTNSFNRECLDVHNLYRAVHNVPALQWSPELARKAQVWANQLKIIAPERPDRLVQPGRRTRNWPHSESAYRNRGVGENIAWDFSSDGSPAKESVMRWYAELFYYDRSNPTLAPAPDKPVGHLTQLLWKDTTHLGCGYATTPIKQRGGYTLLSTWTVSHYSPGGNIRYPNARDTLNLYNKQVPDMRRGSCLTKDFGCSMGNQCMSFGGPNGERSTCSCARSRPMCRGTHGCLAWCENRGGAWNWKSECQGTTECGCTASGAVCK